MRTTLDLSDDVLFAAKEFARQERSSVGEVVSRLVRQALVAQPPANKNTAPAATARRLARLGIHPLPHGGGIVTDALVNRIRDEEGI